MAAVFWIPKAWFFNLQQEIEKVQNRAARFVTSNYCFETCRGGNDNSTKLLKMAIPPILPPQKCHISKACNMIRTFYFSKKSSKPLINSKFSLLNLEYDWNTGKTKMRVSQEKERSRLILLYKGLKGAASIPRDDLIPQLGTAEIITH